MAIVNLRINGHDYQIACDSGQEEHVRVLADEINDRIQALTFKMKTKPGEAMSLVMAALTMADELSENKKEIDRLSRYSAASQAEESDRTLQMEVTMAVTLDEIAQRIEKIAEQVEIR